MNKSKNMSRIIFLLLVATSIWFSGCKDESSIDGLWVVKLVKVGEEEMTPNARWTQFNADSTQQSGNGWFQHSYGTWRLDAVNDKLSVVNTNGITDPYEPFNVRVEDNMMYWDRLEDGQKVQVTLERSDQLPETYGDQLLGLWRLHSLEGEGKYFSGSGSSPRNAIIFFRWDRRFMIRSEKGRINGVYNVHGHKPEVELIPYGADLNRDFWSFAVDKETFTMKLLNSDSVVTRTFTRIHEFPE